MQSLNCSHNSISHRVSQEPVGERRKGNLSGAGIFTAERDTLTPRKEFLAGMHAVPDQMVTVAARPQDLPVGVGRLPGPLLKGLRKVSVIGKTRVHTDREEFVVGLYHELTGIVEADRCHIFLKALVQCLPKKTGQVVHGKPLFPGEIAQKDPASEVFVHILEESGEPLILFVKLGNLLRSHSAAGHVGKERVHYKACHAYAVELVLGLLLCVSQDDIEKLSAQEGTEIFACAFTDQYFLRMHTAQRWEKILGHLHAKESAGSVCAAIFMTA